MKQETVTKQTMLVYIIDVMEDFGRKTKRRYQWVTYTVDDRKHERAICEDPKLFDVMTAARTHEAEIELRHSPATSYPRVIGVSLVADQSLERKQVCG